MLMYVILAIVGLGLLGLLIRGFRAASRRQSVIDHGYRVTAQVVSIQQTGAYFGGQPQADLVVRLQEGQSTRDATIRRYFDLTQIPRIGDTVSLMMDGRNPDALEYIGIESPSARLRGATALPIAEDMIANPAIGVANVQSVSGGTLHLLLDSLIVPPRKVTAPQPADHTYTPGHRVYVYLNGGADAVTVVPLALTGGRPLNTTDTRFDVLVLGPQLLHEGLRATAQVLEARQVALGSGFMHEQGRQKWFLRVRITPQDGSSAFEAADSLVYTNQEKVDRICHVGASIPVRYAPQDHSLWTTDAIALGYPDPFLLQCQSWNAAVANGTVNDL